MFPYVEILGRMVPTYGICMAIGIMTTCIFACIQAQKKCLPVEDLIVIAASAILGALTGAKLLYDIVSFGLLGILKMLINGRISELTANTGFVFYGGLAGGLAGTFVSCRVTGISPSKYYTSAIPFIPVGHAIGRLGCFMAGCCYGKASSLPIAVHFPHSISGLSPEIAVIPTQLFEATGNLAIAIYLFIKYRKMDEGSGALKEYLVLYALLRFFLEYLRGDIIRGSFGFFSTSQWISIFIICVILFSGIITKAVRPGLQKSRMEK